MGQELAVNDIVVYGTRVCSSQSLHVARVDEIQGHSAKCTVLIDGGYTKKPGRKVTLRAANWISLGPVNAAQLFNERILELVRQTGGEKLSFGQVLGGHK